MRDLRDPIYNKMPSNYIIHILIKKDYPEVVRYKNIA